MIPRLCRGGFTWRIEIPANTTATVYIPTSDAASITESGKPIKSVDGVSFLKTEGNRAVFEVGSGCYSFQSRPGGD